jgi:sialate O-acetylesterase
MKRMTVLLLLVMFAARASADVTVEAVDPDGKRIALFSSGMVLQREMTVPVFGHADSGEQVSVSFQGQVRTTSAGSDGTWRVDLDPMPAGGPSVMTISGDNTIVIPDVHVGEVWIASGQSNMLTHRVRPDTLATTPSIRTLRNRGWDDRPGIVPYEFAKKLQANLGVAVGILNVAAGGTNLGYWLGDTATTDPDPEVSQYLNLDWGLYYRKLVKPLQPYRFRGVIWWQGEADYRHPLRHRTLFPALLRSWRVEWAAGDFPWISMQTPTGRGLQVGADSAYALPLSASTTDSSAYMRHTYLRSLEEFSSTSLVTSVDLEGGIHPPEPEAYATRLADHALALVYGKDIVYSGPLFSSMSIDGSSIRIRYRQGTAEGLWTLGQTLTGFAISADGVTWVFADAEIQGNEVVLTSGSVPAPVAARYAWASRPTWANLFNGSGLAAAPFATDVTPGEY